jgi:shikimate dehydrogenase
MISGKAKIAGVMGWPVGHSRSPKLHGYWLNRYNIDGAYIPMAVQPSCIEEALRALPALGFCGCNVTIPHKEEALKHMDSVDPLARRTGAVNTVVIRKDGTLEGLNTDISGFQENLKTAGFPSTGNQQRTATVIGAGGAARAIVVALQEMGFDNIRLVNRSFERAQNCARALRKDGDIRVYGWDKMTEALAGADLLINATSLGMAGQPDFSPALSSLPSTAWVTDLVYTPLETGLLRQARAQGLAVVDGLGMLLHQARPGFAAWFGVEPEVTNALRQHVLDDA